MLFPLPGRLLLSGCLVVEVGTTQGERCFQLHRLCKRRFHCYRETSAELPLDAASSAIRMKQEQEQSRSATRRWLASLSLLPSSRSLVKCHPNDWLCPEARRLSESPVLLLLPLLGMLPATRARGSSSPLVLSFCSVSFLILTVQEFCHVSGTA